MKKIFFLTISLLISSVMFSQEICNNGIDDDGDGLIDLNDTVDCACSSSSTQPSSLIPNPSFEDHSCCPTSYSQLSCADTWIQATDATSDYFNCGYNFGAATSAGLTPPPDGTGYVGAFFLSNWKEYVGTCLTSPLVAGTSYTLEMNIASTPTDGNGDICNGGAIFYSPVDITIFGHANCSQLPYSTYGCPGGGWYVLATTTYTPVSSWGTITFTFTPTANVGAIMIGSPCTLPSSYPSNSSSCDPYFYFDNLILNTSAAFNPVSVTQTGNLCSNDLLLTASSSGTGTYQWYFGGVAIVGETDTTLDVSALGYGAGEYQALFTDTNGCSVAESVVVQDVVTIAIDSTQNVSCNGGADGSISITASGGTTPYTYSWTDLGGYTSTNEDISALSAGTYTVVVNDSNTCSATTTVTITEPTALMLSTTSVDVSCSGFSDGSIDLTSSGGTTPYSYSWTDLGGYTSTNEDISALSAGTYTVVVNDSNACSKTTTVTITEPTALMLSTTSVDVSCSGFSDGSIDLTSSGGTTPYTYSWTGPGGYTSTNEDISGLVAGTYTVVVNDSNACSETTTVTITEPAVLSLSNTSIDVSCAGLSDGSIDLTSSGGTTPYTYNWTGPGGYTSTNEDISGLVAGIYNVIVNDSNACSETSIVTITEPTALEISSPVSIYLCNGRSTIITATTTGGTPNYNYTWNGVSGGSTLVDDPRLTQSYTIIVTDSHGCTDSTKTIVYVSEPVHLELISNKDSVCPGEEVQVTADINSPAGGPYQLHLINGGLITTPFTVLADTSQEVIAIVEDGCGSEDIDTLKLNFYPVPIIDFNPNIYSGCEPLDVKFNQNVIYHPNYSYVWDFGDNQQDNLSYDYNPEHIFEYPGTYDVSLLVRSDKGCENKKTISNLIMVNPKPEAKFTATPSVVSLIKPEVFFTNLSTITDTSYWNFMDGDTSNYTDPVHYYTESGIYDVELIVTSNRGCRDTVTGRVIVEDPITFYAPTAFTPDFDGINDEFLVKASGIKKEGFLLQIYDRWGEVIFESGDINKGWNGVAKGMNEISPVGTYTWVCSFVDIQNNEYKKTGVFTLYK